MSANAHVYRPCGPELAQGHRVSRPRGTGSVGNNVGEVRTENWTYKDTYRTYKDTDGTYKDTYGE